MSKYVDLSERVTATYYDQECEEWTQKTVTVADILDRVCDDYTVLIDAVPTDSISRIEKELHGRDVEMQYEIIRWLWNYGNQFTDSRTAILQWLRGEES